MRHTLTALLLLAICLFTACKDDYEPVDEVNRQTVLVFMPWTGTSGGNEGLLPYFRQNLDSMEVAIRRAKGMDGRALVFLSTGAEQSQLYEMTYDKATNAVVHTPLEDFQGHSYTTSEGITALLETVKAAAPALNYAMIVGCHGTGWPYKADWPNYPYDNAPYTKATRRHAPAAGMGNVTATQPTYYGLHYGSQLPITRFFGSVSDLEYATDIPTLAAGIEGAGIKLQFLLLDDCYMADVENAYTLRRATNFLIGSTSEVMRMGMPYQTMWGALTRQTPDYSAAINSFHEFYSNYQYPYGTLSAVDCRQVEHLAELMKQINEHYTLPDSLRDSIAVLDGFRPTLFYDLGDYVDHLCQNKQLLSDFHEQLDLVVRAVKYTESIPTALYGSLQTIKVKQTSGLTISDPSRNGVALRGREKTEWWKATH